MHCYIVMIRIIDYTNPFLLPNAMGNFENIIYDIMVLWIESGELLFFIRQLEIIVVVCMPYRVDLLHFSIKDFSSYFLKR